MSPGRRRAKTRIIVVHRGEDVSPGRHPMEWGPSVHEMSLAWEICRIAEGEVGRAALPRIREIGIEVGTDAGVEPESLEFCLEALLSRPPFGHARPVLEILDGDDDLRVAWLEVEDAPSPLETAP